MANTETNVTLEEGLKLLAKAANEIKTLKASNEALNVELNAKKASQSAAQSYSEKIVNELIAQGYIKEASKATALENFAKPDLVADQFLTVLEHTKVASIGTPSEADDVLSTDKLNPMADLDAKFLRDLGMA